VTGDEFPRQVARTRNFSLGVPRSFTVAPDGSRVAFLRSRAGADAVTCLWVLDVEAGRERLVFDPRSLSDHEDEASLSDAERARRERVREQAGGVVTYTCDRTVGRAVFSLGGRLFLAEFEGGEVRELDAPGPVDDPRLDPSGSRIAYVIDGALHVLEIDGVDRVLAADDEPDVYWGLPEFVAAEEMHRFRGHWWSPDGTRIAATRVDDRPVRVWYIPDPTNPATPPRAVRYPAAGTDNAFVTLAVFDVDTGARVDVMWDRAAFPYIARVDWSDGAPLALLLQSRDQRATAVVEADHRTGATALLRADTDPSWVDVPDDSFGRLDDGRLVQAVEADDTRRVLIGDRVVTPPGLHVRRIASAGATVLFEASEEPTEVHVWRVAPNREVGQLTHRPGVHTAIEGGDVVVVTSSTEDDLVPRTEVLRDGTVVAAIENVAERPSVEPRPIHVSLGTQELRGALLLPGGSEPKGPLPVLLDPYGGPGFQRVVRTSAAFLASQWFADQGFAVLVVDGRGTPGRGSAWERAMFRDFTVALEDQVDALHAAAERFGFLDTSRVGIRGWSFGGYLAAMAALRRPDVFHAAVAGAPVTKWRLYDTHYTERYLGHPDEEPEVYRRNSILGDAARLERPLMLIHGLADDNVVVAHTLQLSATLFEADRRHELTLLPNVTHLSRSEAATENLLRLQLDFLRRALRLDG
jgi:dipeptidyl-peptidase-4